MLMYSENRGMLIYGENRGMLIYSENKGMLMYSENRVCSGLEYWVGFQNFVFFKPSRKHTYIILTPLNPTLHWGLQGYTLFFLFLLKNIDCGYPQSMF